MKDIIKELEKNGIKYEFMIGPAPLHDMIVQFDNHRVIQSDYCYAVELHKGTIRSKTLRCSRAARVFMQNNNVLG